jgi:hypothetical protein
MDRDGSVGAATGVRVGDFFFFAGICVETALQTIQRF